MNNKDIQEIQNGIDWVRGLLNKVQNDISLPVQYKRFSRRLSQIKCNNILANKKSISSFYSLTRLVLGAGYINFLVLKSYFHKEKIKGAFSIWDNETYNFVNDETFKEFVETRQVVQQGDGILIVKSKSNGHEDRKTLFIEEPIYNTILYLKVSIFQLIQLNFYLTKNILFFIKSLKIFNDSHEIFKDFLTGPVVKLYRQNGLVKIFRTNAEVSSQEFWCEDIDFNTVWYSTNSRAMLYKNTPFDHVLEHPFFYTAYYGKSWAWNKSHADWLNSLSPHTICVVGPIIFTPIVKKINKEKRAKRLLVFDVTPFNTEYLRSQLFHHGIIYYNEKNSIDFMNTILSVSHEFEWEVVLKPKRAYVDSHSKKYIDFLQCQVNSNNNFSIAEPSADLIEEIMQADLVISIPLTSPFEIAKHLKVPSYYLDPTGSIDFNKMGYSEEDIVKDPQSLKCIMDKLNNASL